MRYLAFVLTVIFLIWFAHRLFNVRPAPKSQTEPQGPWPFYARHPLNAAEQVLYHRLSMALPEYIILAQVPLTRVMGVSKGHNFFEWQPRIRDLQLDFLICRKDFSVVAAVELDEDNQQGLVRQAVDERITRVCRDAELRLIRWHTRLMPDELAIRAAFSEPVLSRPADPHVLDQEFEDMVAKAQ